MTTSPKITGNRKSDIDNDMIPGDNRQSDSDNDMIPVIRKVTKKTGTLHDFFKTKDREEDFNGRCHQNRKEEKENSIEGTNNYSHQSEKLKNHQLEAVNFLYSNCYGNTAESTKESGHGSVLAHCMGLGKSFTGNAKKKNQTKSHLKKLLNLNFLFICSYCIHQQGCSSKFSFR